MRHVVATTTRDKHLLQQHLPYWRQHKIYDHNSGIDTVACSNVVVVPGGYHNTVIYYTNVYTYFKPK